MKQPIFKTTTPADPEKLRRFTELQRLFTMQLAQELDVPLGIVWTQEGNSN